MVVVPDEDLDLVRSERDLYRHCMAMSSATEPAALLERTLELLRDTTGAQQGYIEVRELRTGRTSRWAADAGLDLDELSVVQRRISTNIVSSAIAAGQTVHTASAVLDPRFEEHDSVRRGLIEAVLCVPIRAEGVEGAIYLQNRTGGGAFVDETVVQVEFIARYVSSLAGRLIELVARREEFANLDKLRSRLELDGVVGRSPALLVVLRRIAVVAELQTNVLLTGPSGTGKSMFAHILHHSSARSSGPLIELNCAAVPESLFESELFGAEQGAHSGVAGHAMAGKISAADSGTLFLDEIGELSRESQAKLLQFLQSKTYFPLGATKAKQADVRIIAATNRDLRHAIREQRFREDLYFRLRGIEIKAPTLEERREDIGELAQHFCYESCDRNELPLMEISSSALAVLEYREWPGNIRELANLCETAVINARIEGATRLEHRHFVDEAGAEGAAPPTMTFQSATAAFQRSFLDRSLDEQSWNVTATARSLEMSRSHLNALISRFGLHRKA